MSESWNIALDLNGCAAWFLAGVVAAWLIQLAVYVYLRQRARRFRRDTDA